MGHATGTNRHFFSQDKFMLHGCTFCGIRGHSQSRCRHRLAQQYPLKNHKTGTPTPPQSESAPGKLIGRANVPYGNRSEGKDIVVGSIGREPFVENMMKVRIFQHRFDALVDTGANISAISEETLRKIQTTQKIQIHPPRVGEVKIADGAKITAIASINIPIQSETKTIYYQDFMVFKTLAQDIILGIDFLTKNKAVLNFEE
jgi:hypothetical protein